MVKLGSPRKISSKLAEEQNGLFFFTPTLQQVTYFFFLQVPLSTNYFSASLTGCLRKRKEYFEPPDKFGGKYNFGGARGFESPPIRASPPTGCRRYFRYPFLSSSAPDRAALCGLRRRVVPDRAFFVGGGVTCFGSTAAHLTPKPHRRRRRSSLSRG